MARARLRIISRSLRRDKLDVGREDWALAVAGSWSTWRNSDLSRRIVFMAPYVTVRVAAMTASWGRKVLPEAWP